MPTPPAPTPAPPPEATPAAPSPVAGAEPAPGAGASASASASASAEPTPSPAAAVEPSPEPAPAVSIRGLTKRFKKFTAVDDLTLEVARGEVFGFLGPNGCGKTTTIRMLTGSIAPSAGTAEVLGVDVVNHPELVRPRIGYMSQKFSLFSDMSVDENLAFYAGVYGVEGEQFAQRRDEVLAMSELGDRTRELPRNLSVGMRQRLALGVATIHRPEVLFLDEPTGGVDPVARRAFWDLLYGLAETGVTLFVTTHYMEEVSNCTRMAFMYAGRLVADDAPRHIRSAMATPENPHPSIEDVFVTLVERHGA